MSGQEIAAELADNQGKVLDGGVDVELAFAVLARAEGVANLCKADGRLRGGEEVEQNLEAAGLESRRTGENKGAARDKEAAHGIGDLAFTHGVADVFAQAAEQDAAACKVTHAATICVARADDKIKLLLPRKGEHAGQDALVVLHVGVHHGHPVGGTGEDAFDTGRGEAPAADAVQQADACVLTGKGADCFGGAVRGVVVDEDGLPSQAVQGDGQAAQQLGDVLSLVIGGQNDGKLHVAARPLGLTLRTAQRVVRR